MADTPPTEQQLDEIAARAAHLHEYVAVDVEGAQPDFDKLTGEDVPALLTALLNSRAENEGLREKHKAGLRRADEINNQLMQEVQRYAAGTEQPVLWSVYNAMHLRAANAESLVERVQRVARRLAAHAAGFRDVLDDSDRDPWAKTVGADIAELIDVLSDAPAAVAAVAETGGTPA